jgi:nucleoside-diphosphate-sugar epimerase
MEEVNVNGTRDLIVACQQNGVKRVVYISTIGAYDWSQIPLTGASENSPLHPITAYTSTKLQGECLIQASGLDWRILRLATVFGTGDRANFARLARSLKKKNFFVPGTGAARKSVIPIDLATAIIVKMSGIEEPKHRLINVALSHAPTLREVCDGFSSVCGFRNAHSIPLVLLRTGAIAGEVISRFWPAFPLTNFTLTKLVTSTVVDNRRLVETLPDLPMPDFTDALRSFKEYYTNI